MEKLKYVVLEMPDYYFNYDKSKTNVFYFQINHYEQFDDYHNFKDYNHIREYKVYKDMFLKKFSRNVSSFSANSEECFEIFKENKIEELFKSKAPHVLRIERKETIEENKNIFNNILQMLSEFNVKVFILIMPHPFAEYLAFSKEIDRTRSEFFDILNEYKQIYNYEILDYYNIYWNSNIYFRDQVHLNSIGAKAFSKMLNEKLKECYEF